MRTIFRLCLVAAVVAAFGLVAVPVASADAGPTGHASITNFEKKQNKRIKKAKNKAAKAHERIEAIKDWNFTQDDRLGAAEDLLGQIVAVAVPLVSAIQNQIVPGLEAINTALKDPTTGLVGLNLARPQFAAFDENGAFLAGTSDAGGMGPDADAVQGGTAGLDLDGFFVVDFNNDVSSRVFSVNVFPLGPPALGGGAANTASAVNCASNTDTAGLCGIVQDGPAGDPDPDPNKVVVQYGDGTAGGPANGFTLTAFSG